MMNLERKVLFISKIPPEWDVEPGAWMLTSYKDIMEVSSNPSVFSSQAATGNLITLGDPETRHPKLMANLY